MGSAASMIALICGCASVGDAGTVASALRVRTTELIAPCVESAARAFAVSGPVSVDTGALNTDGLADVDVIVGSLVEITHALEGGRADDATDILVARVPWVLVRAEGAPVQVRSLADAAASQAEVAVPDEPAAFEARRTLAAAGVRRVRAVSIAELRRAPLALLPLSLTQAASRLATDVPPLIVQAAVTSKASHRATAQAFTRFLVSEAGQQAFTRCGQQP